MPYGLKLSLAWLGLAWLGLAWITALFATYALRVKNLFLAPCLSFHEYSDDYLGMPIVHCICLAVLELECS